MSKLHNNFSLLPFIGEKCCAIFSAINLLRVSKSSTSAHQRIQAIYNTLANNP